MSCAPATRGRSTSPLARKAGRVIGRRAVAVGAGSTDLDGQLIDLFEADYDRLVRLAALICHTSALVEDAVQAAMEQAWRRRHMLKDPKRLRPWLDQIVVREAIRL